MVTIQAIASSSAGNCYALKSGDSTLLVEAGVRWKAVQESLGFKTSELDGILVTHEHGDHSKSVKGALRAGVDVYMSAGTADALNISKHHRVHCVSPLVPFTVNSWTVLPFDIVHDAAEPLGYLINSSTGDKVLFLTDTSYCKYKFKALNYLILECNFSDDILEENIKKGIVDAARKKRLIDSHFSLERVKDFILANDMSAVREIHLVHLSQHNSDERLFQSEIQKLTGIPVYVAKA